MITVRTICPECRTPGTVKIETRDQRAACPECKRIYRALDFLATDTARIDMVIAADLKERIRLAVERKRVHGGYASISQFVVRAIVKLLEEEENK